MAKIKKIVTKGMLWCEHCEYFGDCNNLRALQEKDSGKMLAWAEKTKIRGKKRVHIDIECRFDEAILYGFELDLPNIVDGLNGYQVSSFEDYEVYVYKYKELQIIGFVNNQGAYYCTHPDIEGEYIHPDTYGVSGPYTYPRPIYSIEPEVHVFNVLKIRGRVPGKNSKKWEAELETWLKKHDDDLSWCFELIDKGREPEPFK